MVAALLLLGCSFLVDLSQPARVFKGQGGFRPDLRGQGYGRDIVGKGKKLERFWLG